MPLIPFMGRMPHRISNLHGHTVLLRRFYPQINTDVRRLIKLYYACYHTVMSTICGNLANLRINLFRLSNQHLAPPVHASPSKHRQNCPCYTASPFPNTDRIVCATLLALSKHRQDCLCYVAAIQKDLPTSRSSRRARFRRLRWLPHRNRPTFRKTWAARH